MRPFLRDSDTLLHRAPARRQGPGETSPTIAAALHAGIPVLNASPKFDAQLPPTADALLAFQNAPGVRTGLDRLIDTNQILSPTVNFLAPVQTTCNYLSLPSGTSPARSRTTARATGAAHRLHAAAGPERRGLAGRGARKRPHALQPPARQPLSEHGLAGPAARVRGGQRDLRRRQDRDRQPAGRQRHRRPDRAAQGGKDELPEDERDTGPAANSSAAAAAEPARSR